MIEMVYIIFTFMGEQQIILLLTTLRKKSHLILVLYFILAEKIHNVI